MATTLFELEATLGLNSSGFDSNVSSAQGKMQGLASSVSVGASSIDDDIAALDKEIADLDDAIANLQLDMTIEDLDAEIADLESQVRNSDFRTSFFEGLYSGLSEAATDMIKDAIQAGFQFVAESVADAAESGTRAAEDYQRATQRMEVGTQTLSNEIGQRLLPLLTTVTDAVADLLGVTDEDVRLALLDDLESYKFENLKQAEASLRGIFGFGEAYEAQESDKDYTSVMSGFQSQQEYWESYVQLVSDLRTRGIDHELIAQYASGSTSDYAQLTWLASLTDQQIAELEQAQAQTEEARAHAAEILSLLQLEGDETYNTMYEQYQRYVVPFGSEKQAENYESLAVSLIEEAMRLSGMSEEDKAFATDLFGAEGIGSVLELIAQTNYAPEDVLWGDIMLGLEKMGVTSDGLEALAALYTTTQSAQASHGYAEEQIAAMKETVATMREELAVIRAEREKDVNVEVLIDGEQVAAVVRQKIADDLNNAKVATGQ